MKLPCQSGDADRFFPSSSVPMHQINAVKAECRPCPMREACLDWALVHGEEGIWAGTTEKERAQIRHLRHINVQRVQVTIHEDRAEMVRRMVARGMTGPEIARALGISKSGAGQAMVRAKRRAS